MAKRFPPPSHRLGKVKENPTGLARRGNSRVLRFSIIPALRAPTPMVMILGGSEWVGIWVFLAHRFC